MTGPIYPQPNLHPLSEEDERMIREHHVSDQGYERCVTCRLLATLDAVRESRPVARPPRSKGFQPMRDGIDYDSSEQ